MKIVCRYPLEQGGIENRDFKNVLPWEATVATVATLVCHRILLLRLFLPLLV